MLRSLYSFLHTSIDYAGIYPPANLSIEMALRKYSEYRNIAESWMLARFVIGTPFLPQLENFEEIFLAPPKFRFSILNQKTKKLESFPQTLDSDIQQVETFIENYKSNIQIESFEIRLPEAVGLTSDEKAILNVLDRTMSVVEASNLPRDIQIFFESTYPGNWKIKLENVLNGLSTLNHTLAKKSYNPNRIGFKIRTGGETKASIPSVEFVSRVIYECGRLNIPLKATAGLHHPLRHYDIGSDQILHGFINLIGAAVLNYENELTLETIQKIIETEDTNDFVFGNGDFRWNNYAISEVKIAEARQRTFISFGSCDFDDPRLDLKKLHYKLRP
ncbi:MAG: hypothetical protein ACFFFG_06745 [Candidatus Thorarchaeota archaeon]